MEKLVSLCKRRGFIYQSSEIYGGIGGFWDYGPLGAELKRNLRDTWWRAMTREREDVVGLDATIIMHPQIWKASGHVDTFTDPMADCLLTKKRFRADHVDLQSGMVYHFTGATGEEGTKSDVPFAVLTPFGKPRESALKVAKLFYESRGVKTPEPTGGEQGEKVENTRATTPRTVPNSRSRARSTSCSRPTWARPPRRRTWHTCARRPPRRSSPSSATWWTPPA